MQRGVLQAFAIELAQRFEVIGPYREFDALGDLDADEPDTFEVSANPTKDLEEQRLLLIESFGIDPLRVLPGTRPS